MTMLKPKISMSPVKLKSTPKKRPLEATPSKDSTMDNERPSKVMKQDAGARFTFDDVKMILDAVLAQDKKKLESSINSGIKHIDYKDLAPPGHSVEQCQELLDKLIERTRRVRTTEEVLRDIRDNLNKRLYTDIIQRFGMTKEPPKRPASAYFLFHKERFPQLRDQLMEDYEVWVRNNPGSQEKKPPLASTVAVKVSQEWREMSPQQRDHYQKLHNDLMKKYEKDIKKLGLTHLKKPKRPKSAKLMYLQSRLAELDKQPSKAKLVKLKQKFREEFDKADSATKEYWNTLAKEEYKQYTLDTLKFCENNPHLDRNDIIKVRKRKDKIVPPAPPRNPCRIYMDKKLPENLEGQELKDTESKLKEKFTKLSLKKSLKYIKKAVKEKEQYEADMAKFAAEHPDFPLPHPKTNVTREQWKLYQSHVENKPVPPPTTAYLYYCSKIMINLNDVDQKPTKRLQAASAAWLALSQTEKAEAHREHIECIKQYIEDMEDWLSKQDEARIERVFREDPKSKPDYWRKRLAKLERALLKKDFD
uniref:Nucleolar transcription factor 1 n=1 Tax=Aceria tosichella TaxID=561515 RepID=A0A6G1SM57_9ACAR